MFVFSLHRIITLISCQTTKARIHITDIQLTANLAGMQKHLFHKARHAILDFLENLGSKPQLYSKEAGPERTDLARVAEQMCRAGRTACCSARIAHDLADMKSRTHPLPAPGQPVPEPSSPAVGNHYYPMSASAFTTSPADPPALVPSHCPMTIFNPESQISVHGLLRQRLGKVQKALYWRSLPPFTGARSQGLHPEDPGSTPTPTGPAERLNSRSGHWYSVGEEEGGKCLRKNRSLCTSDIFITHKLGSADPRPRCPSTEVEASPESR